MTAAVAMVAACVGVALWAAGVPWTYAAGGALLATVSVIPLVRRLRRRGRARQAPDADRFESEIARLNARIKELEAKIAVVDQRVVEIGRSTARAVASELVTVGSVMRDLAETVAMHDAELFAARAADLSPPPESPRREEHAEGPPAAPRDPAQMRGGLPQDVPPASWPASPEGGTPVAVAPEDREAVERALREGAVEVMLQAVVTLPQRRVRLYEAQARVRRSAGEALEGVRVERAAQAAGLARELDRFVLPHVIRVARHLAARGRDVPVVFRVGPTALLDAALFRMLAAAIARDSGLANHILFEVPLATFRHAEALELEALEALEGLGVRFVLDRVPDLVLEAHSLARRGVRFVKISAAVIIAAGQGKVPAEIHPADLAGYLARHGVSLVAAEVEDEATAVEVFEFDVPLGIGAAYAPPRAVRLDVLDDSAPPAPPAPPDAGAPVSVEPKAVPAQAPSGPGVSLRPAPAGEGPAVAATRAAQEPERARGAPLRAFLRRTSG
ncbi:MAG: EAL domain-containing protein [Alsobacter sp.]